MTAKSSATARLLLRFVRAEGAATAIEYAVIAGFLSIAIAGAATIIGQNIGGLYDQIVASLGG